MRISFPKKKIQIGLVILILLATSVAVWRYRFYAAGNPNYTIVGAMGNEDTKGLEDGVRATFTPSDDKISPISATTHNFNGFHGYYSLTIPVTAPNGVLSFYKEGFKYLQVAVNLPADLGGWQFSASAALKPGTGDETGGFYISNFKGRRFASISLPFRPYDASAKIFQSFYNDGQKYWTEPILLNYDKFQTELYTEDGCGGLQQFDRNNPQSLKFEPGKAYYFYDKSTDFHSFIVKGEQNNISFTLPLNFPTCTTSIGLNSLNRQVTPFGNPYFSSLSSIKDIRVKYGDGSVHSLYEAVIANKVDKTAIIRTGLSPKEIKTLDLTQEQIFLPGGGYLFKALEPGLSLQLGQKTSGIIKDSATNAPLSGVEVTLKSDDARFQTDLVSVTSDNNGNFNVFGLNSSYDKVIIHKDGYKTIAVTLSNNFNVSNFPLSISLEKGAGMIDMQAIAAVKGQELKFGLSLNPKDSTKITVSDPVQAFDIDQQGFVPFNGLKAGQIYSVTPSSNYTIIIPSESSDVIENTDTSPPVSPSEEFMVTKPGTTYFLASSSLNTETFHRYMITNAGNEYDLADAAKSGLINPEVTINSQKINLTQLSVKDLNNYKINPGDVFSFVDKANFTFSKYGDETELAYYTGYLLIPQLNDALFKEGVSADGIGDVLAQLDSCEPSFFDRRADETDRTNCLNSVQFQDDPPPTTDGNISFIKKAFAATGSRKKQVVEFSYESFLATLKNRTDRPELAINFEMDTRDFVAKHHPSKTDPMYPVYKKIQDEHYKNAARYWAEFYFNANTQPKQDASGCGGGLCPFVNKRFWSQGESPTQGSIASSALLSSLYGYYWPDLQKNRYLPKFTAEEIKRLEAVYNAGLNKLELPSPGNAVPDIWSDFIIADGVAAIIKSMGLSITRAVVENQVERNTASVFTKEVSKDITGVVRKQLAKVFGKTNLTPASKFTVEAPDVQRLMGIEPTPIEIQPNWLRPVSKTFTFPQMKKLYKFKSNVLNKIVNKNPEVLDAFKIGYKGQEKAIGYNLFTDIRGGTIFSKEEVDAAGYYQKYTGSGLNINLAKMESRYVKKVIYHEGTHNLLEGATRYDIKYLREKFGIIRKDGTPYYPIEEMECDMVGNIVLVNDGQKAYLASELAYSDVGHISNALAGVLMRAQGIKPSVEGVWNAKKIIALDIAKYGPEDAIDAHFGWAAEQAHIVKYQESFHEWLNKQLLEVYHGKQTYNNIMHKIGEMNPNDILVDISQKVPQ